MTCLLPFITTGPDTDLASPGNRVLLNRSGLLFCALFCLGVHVWVFSHAVATLLAECSRCSPPSRLVCGQLLTVTLLHIFEQDSKIFFTGWTVALVGPELIEKWLITFIVLQWYWSTTGMSECNVTLQFQRKWLYVLQGCWKSGQIWTYGKFTCVVR